MTETHFNPRDPLLRSAPQTVYGRLRAQAPLLRTVVGGQPVNLLCRYKDVAQVATDPTTLMNPPGTPVPRPYQDGPASILWRNAISMMDPPKHTHCRRAIAPPFSRRRIQELRPLVTDVVTEVFSGLDGNEFDVVSDVALKVPMEVICRLLGIPTADWPDLESWSIDFLRIFLPDAATPDEVDRIQSASQNFLDYFGGLIDERIRRPNDDLITDYTAAIDEPDGLTRTGLIGALRGLLTAGFETTAATISASFLGFAQQPEQFQRLHDDPGQIPSAIEELLRWETPVRVMVRYLAEEWELHGSVIPRGEAVWLLLGSANHDEEHYKDPENIDVTRDPRDHLTFGGGRHLCLGAYLARLELETVLGELTRRWRHIDTDVSSVVRRGNFQFPSIEALPVSVRP